MASVLERGDVFFLYRPRVDEPDARGLDEVQRLYMILRPRDRRLYRRLVIGRKRLPEPAGHERHWAFVDRVAAEPEPVVAELRELRYATKTRGERTQPAARPAGEGVYAIVDHDKHCHLAYRLELPLRPGEVQAAFRIKPQASYIAAVRNPEAPPPPGLEASGPEVVDYPDELLARFRGRRFAPLERAFLDQVGTELVLIGASEDVEDELGIELDAEREGKQAAEIFTELALDRVQHPIAPLIRGEWT